MKKIDLSAAARGLHVELSATVRWGLQRPDLPSGWTPGGGTFVISLPYHQFLIEHRLSSSPVRG